MKTFYSNGKLLFSGEYAVLDGATALAVPTSFGQSLQVELLEEPGVQWKSLGHEEEVWFEGGFRLENDELKALCYGENGSGSHPEVLERLKNVLNQAHQLNPNILTKRSGYAVTTKMDFPRNWGLGSSSTLVNNVAQWFKIDPYQLLEKTFGGSGYDIACAQHNYPITFALTPGGRKMLAAGFDPAFREALFFVHLNRKQSSRESIAHYRSQPRRELEEALEKISSITHQMLNAGTILEFELLLEIHETIISQLINTPKIKLQLFPDYPRAIKSLGGWGGDFILATGGEQEKAYFRKKGFTTVLDYREMMLHPT